MQLILKFLLVILLVTVFASHSVINENIEIDLVHEKIDEQFFIDTDFFYSSIVIKNFTETPKYLNNLKSQYKGLPKNDSLDYFRCFDNMSFMFELNKSGDLSDASMEGIIRGEDLDTLNISKVKLKSPLIIIVGFSGSKQFMIADTNRNKDFSDDIKFEYDINFRNNPYENLQVLKSQSIASYSYEDCSKGNISKYDKNFIIYPDRFNAFSIAVSDNPNKYKEYCSVIKIRDYYKAEAVLNNIKVDIYYHGYSNKYGIVTVKPKKIAYKRNDEVFESKYKSKYYANRMFDDTIVIGNARFLIDSISRNISKLYLKKIAKSTRNFGNRNGEIVGNFKYLALDNKKVDFKQITSQKKYTLLEFWGTWCGPCVAMTPKLKNAYKKHSSKLNMISIATNDDLLTIKKYVSKNKLNWQFGYIPGRSSWENPIIKQLKVEFYPTLILVDSNGKIITRGSAEILDELDTLIQ